MLLDSDPPAPPAGGAPPPADPPPPQKTWRDDLPADIKDNPILQRFNDVPSAVKSLIHAETLIGAKRVAVPGKNAQAKDWDEFHNAIGRPESPDKYSVPELKLEEGIELDENQVKKAREAFHKAGLTNKQFQAVLAHYADYLNDSHKAMTAAQTEKQAQAERELREKWQANYDGNVEIAQAALRKFGSAELNQMLDSTGMGNNPELVKTFYDIGKMLDEDTAQGRGSGLPADGPGAALQQITALNADETFMKQLHNRDEFGHREAVERMKALYAQAYPGTQKD